MTVYVDDMEADYRRMKMSHLIADTTEELLQMVDKIGVPRKWIQFPGTWKEHFDIALGKKMLALTEGAKQITWRQYSCMVRYREKNGKLPPGPIDTYIPCDS